MNKILDLKEAIRLSKTTKKQRESIVLVGGCFDILHAGHIKFLTLAKKQGDILFVLLESDKNVRKLKGEDRPINQQMDRAIVLSSLTYVDYIVLLSQISKNRQYDDIIRSLNPDVLATTENEEVNRHLERQAKEVKARIIYVTKRIKNHSTTKFAGLIKTYGL